MTGKDPGDLISQLRARLKGKCRFAIVGIGDECRTDDRLGMIAARRLAELNLDGMKVFFGGTIPETISAPVRRFQPDHVLLIVSADTGAGPGAAILVEEGKQEIRLFTDHYYPLALEKEMLGEGGKVGVSVIAIQPDIGHTGAAITPQEEKGVGLLVECITRVLADCSAKK